MNVNPCFPILFFSFSNPDIIEPALDQMKLERNHVAPQYPSLLQTTDQNLHRSEEWRFMWEWIDQCLAELQDHEQHDPRYGRLKITDLWGNVAAPRSNGNHSLHRHPNSMYSGVIYLTEGSPTEFVDPVYARILSSIEIPSANNFDRLTISPSPGSMVIFPSFIQHYTHGHLGDDHRITMSFNCLPESFATRFNDN